MLPDVLKKRPTHYGSFEPKEGIIAPFYDDIIKIDDNVSLIQKKRGNRYVATPMYLHSFGFITPRKISEVQKFTLKFPNADMITSVADKLRYYRYKKGLLQVEVADYLGIERSTYISYEDSTRDYYEGKMMDKIAELLEVDVFDLLDDYNKFLYNGQGAYIKRLRKELHITQMEFAKMMGVQLFKAKRWEQNKVRMFKGTWEKLMEMEGNIDSLKRKV